MYWLLDFDRSSDWYAELLSMRSPEEDDSAPNTAVSSMPAFTFNPFKIAQTGICLQERGLIICYWLERRVLRGAEQMLRKVAQILSNERINERKGKPSEQHLRSRCWRLLCCARIHTKLNSSVLQLHKGIDKQASLQGGRLIFPYGPQKEKPDITQMFSTSSVPSLIC